MHDSPEHGAGGEFDDANPYDLPADVRSYYNQGLELARLTLTPEGRLLQLRLQDILARMLPAPPATILDLGCGPGLTACWLAERGYAVHCVDPVPTHVRQAQAASSDQPSTPLANIRLGDIRHLEEPDAAFDAVLVSSQLYHVADSGERVLALKEALRVVRPGGRVIVVGLARSTMVLEGLRRGYVREPAFRMLAENGLATGLNAPAQLDPATVRQAPDIYFATAALQQPAELRREMATAGLAPSQTLALEGPAWLFEELPRYLETAPGCQLLLDLLRPIESDANLIGASKHFLVVASRP